MEIDSPSVHYITELTQELNMKPPGRSEAGEPSHIFSYVVLNV